MKNMLIIGGTTPGGIGETIANYAAGAEGYETRCPTPQELDVTDFDGVQKYLLEYGPFGCTVYCAGVQYLGKLDDLDPQQVQAIFDVNVIGFINVMAALTRQQAMGKVCAISSLAGRVPMTGSIGYCASKAALNHAVRCAAREMKSDWQITAIVPATVGDTPLTLSVDHQVMYMRNWDRDELLKQERIRQPFGRRIRKDEIAELVLATFDGPMTLTGSVIDLTGGA
jgi:NAD(P)-dependent dehydrogenase (short-subunit alcohol dehydrogenase family)